MAGTYLFIDGGYLERRYTDAMQAVYGDAGDLDYALVTQGMNVDRIFYYNASETKRSDEGEAEFQVRRAAQENRFEAISDLADFHVRAGVLRGGKKGQERKQKEVDIQLAVDMLLHAIRGTMKQAKLIAGDRDFRPLVQATVDLGVRVEVLYAKRSCADELRRAADLGTPLRLRRFWDWSSATWRQSRSIVGEGIESASNKLPLSHVLVGDGVAGKFKITAHRNEQNRNYYCYLLHFRPDAHLQLVHPDIHLIEKYVQYEYGPLVWSNPLNLAV